MNPVPAQFNHIVESVYNLPLDERVELKNLLEHNIAEARRNEILSNFTEAKGAHKNGDLKFSSDADELKNMR